jgi:CHASE1-domain containing sensor protein
MNPYIIIYVDSYQSSEAEPQYKYLLLSDEQYKEMKEQVSDFEATRRPYFYPQMYIKPLNPSNLPEVKDWIDELKEEVIEWKNEKK